MLNEGKKQPLIAGNIGTVASEVAQEAKEFNQIVIELSSFQLMGITTFRPRIAILTNLYDAHLDYHGTRSEYVKAKANITKNQTEEDYFIVNAEQEEVMEIARNSKAQIIPFSAKRELASGAFVKDGWVVFNGEQIMQNSGYSIAW